MMINFNVLDKIREAQKIAVKENIKVNAVHLSKDFVKIPKLTTQNTEYSCVSVTNPMICGIRFYIDNDNELPEEYAFALFDDGQDSLVKSIEYNKTKEILTKLIEIYKDNPIVLERHLQDVFKNEWGVELDCNDY